MSDLTLHSPSWLALLLALPLLAWLRRRRPVSVLFVPFAASWHRRPRFTPSRLPGFLAIAGLALLIVAAARPQRIDERRETKSQGYDLILAIDLSGSMLSEDFERNGQRINRLQVIKPVIQAFISRRPADRIGIVIFSGRAYTLSPLTFDHDWLARQVERLKIGLIEDGTAIGDGLGVALTRLEQASRETEGHRMGAFVVLLTDGANNRGAMTPEQATEIAKSRSIPVYTIGAGREGSVPYPVFDQNNNRIGSRRVPSDLDEPALREIANQTGGKYFRADDVRTVEDAFASIDRAKKIEFQAKRFLVTTELFWIPATAGAVCLLLASILEHGRHGRFKPNLQTPPTIKTVAQSRSTMSVRG
ncbi:MAG: VWA domain-containing protein [Opitutaceae bacterium]|nr:VWA domain-containing protein [Opitutaceae bacterium]